MNIFHCLGWIYLISQLNYCSCRPPGIVYRVVREYEPDSFSSVTIKRADEDSSDEEDNNDLKSFVTSSSVDDYSEYGRRLNSKPNSTLLLNAKTSSSPSSSSNWTPVIRKEKRQEKERRSEKSWRKEDEESRRGNGNEAEEVEDGDYEKDAESDDHLKDEGGEDTSWQNDSMPETNENEFKIDGRDDHEGGEQINSPQLRQQGEELHPSLITGINPDHDYQISSPALNVNGDKTSTLMDSYEQDSMTTPTLSSPSPLLPPPTDYSTESIIDPIRLISNGNGTFFHQSTVTQFPIYETSEVWTPSPPLVTTVSPTVAKTKDRRRLVSKARNEESDDYDEDPLDPIHIGMDQYRKSNLIKPKVKRYHRKEVTTSPAGSYFHESHHVTKELLPGEVKEGSERDSVLGDDYDDPDYDTVGNYPTKVSANDDVDHDDGDTYQAAGDGDEDGGTSSSGGGIFGYSDTYPYEDEDKDDVAYDDKDDDKDVDDDDDTLESKSEMYVQSGTDNIPDDLRSPELVDVPSDPKEAEADKFMKSREAESDRIFGNLEQSEVIRASS